jgi:hypothetical protein
VSARRLFSDEAAHKIAEIAARLAIEAPRRRSQFSQSAQLPWASVEELRAALAESGFPLDVAFDRLAEIKRERRNAR